MIWNAKAATLNFALHKNIERQQGKQKQATKQAKQTRQAQVAWGSNTMSRGPQGNPRPYASMPVLGLDLIPYLTDAPAASLDRADTSPAGGNQDLHPYHTALPRTAPALS